MHRTTTTFLCSLLLLSCAKPPLHPGSSSDSQAERSSVAKNSESSLQERFKNFLNPRGEADLGIPIPTLDRKLAEKLHMRVENIKLYLHSYALLWNFEQGGFSVRDMMDLAKEQSLDGITLHILDGGKKYALEFRSPQELRDLAAYAKARGLGLNLETSSTAKAEIDKIVAIARHIGVRSLRVYIRSEGRITEIANQAVEDLVYAAQIAAKHDLEIVLENHEVLMAEELVDVIKKVGSPHIRLLYDFGNMINSNEDSYSALQTMAPYVTQVHFKDIVIGEQNGVRGQLGVKSGTGMVNQQKLLFDLLMLGDNEAQVPIIAIEEEVAFFSPLRRFADEPENPFIAKRLPSTTPFPKILSEEKKQRLLLSEMKNAKEAIAVARSHLSTLRGLAAERLALAHRSTTAAPSGTYGAPFLRPSFMRPKRSAVRLIIGESRKCPRKEERTRPTAMFAPNAPLRNAVTSLAGKAIDPILTGAPNQPKEAPPRKNRGARYLWAALLARIYEAMPLVCPDCGGEMRLIAAITDPPTIQRILSHIGQPIRPPAIAPARGPPE